MKKLLISCCLIMLAHCAFTQDSTLKKHYYLKAFVTENNKKAQKTFLVDINDTAVVVCTEPVQFRQGIVNANVKTRSISYQQINSITIRRRGGTGRGIALGALLGATTGAAIAHASGPGCSDCAGETEIAAGAIAGGLLGTVVGAIIGGQSERRFFIKGDKQKFDKMRLAVLKKAYRKL